MDTISAEKRSWTMSRVKSSGNLSTEERLAKLFRQNKIKGWRRKYPLFGKPDFVFPKSRTVVFVDGCFWHGHPTLCRIPKTNKEYWVRKINRNKERDALVSKTLEAKGWKVIRLWENELKDPELALTKVKKKLNISR